MGRRGLHPATHIGAFALAAPLSLLSNPGLATGRAVALLAGLVGAAVQAAAAADAEGPRTIGLAAGLSWLRVVTGPGVEGSLGTVWEHRCTDDALLTPLRRFCR